MRDDRPPLIVLLALLPVIGLVVVGLDYLLGRTEEMRCLVHDKSWHLSCPPKAGCRAVYEFDVQCPETNESATSSSAFWYAHDIGDDLTIEVSTSRLLGMKSAKVIE